MKKIMLFCVIGLSFLLGGCAENVSPNVYTAEDTGQLNQAIPATIVAMRPVTISTNTGTGGVVGAVAGGTAGSLIGGSTEAHILGALGGAVIGGVAGHAIEGGIGKKQGMEYVLKLNNGKLVTVTQTQDLHLSLHQKVMIIYGKQTRIVPY
jgi:outer membrane lipoprotein SlyB